MPIQPVTLCSWRVVVLHLAVERLDADREQEREHEHDRRVPEREEEADAQRPLAFGHQLARGVVDRRDVVGVEGVAHAERVGGHAGPDRERPRAPEVVVVRRDDRDQEEEAERVQPTTAAIIATVRHCEELSEDGLGAGSFCRRL